MRRELLRDPRVKFAGYKHPHPLDNDILIRIQTVVGSTPVQVLSESAKRLEDEFRTLQTQFERHVADLAREAERL
jgi:DNA-directed RNA polymerase II subunit RPB11